MFEKLSDNLNLLMDEVHISADELARRTGVPASTIKKIRNRYNPNPTLSTLLPLTKFFAITIDQLIGNEPLPSSREKGLHQTPAHVLNFIPLISWLEAIGWPKTKEKNHESISTEYAYSIDAYALLVEEDNWENLAKGTALLIDPTIKPEHRDFAIAYKTGQTIPSLKQILIDDGLMYLKPIVQGYNITPLTDDYSILGIVVEYKKHLKKLANI